MGLGDLAGRTVAIGARGGRIVHAPPTYRRFIGSPTTLVAQWFRARGATFRPLHRG